MQPNDNPGTGGNWSFRKEDDDGISQPESDVQPRQQTSEPVSWTASEFIAHHKSPGWYAALIGGLVILSILIYALTKDIISIAAITIVFILFIIAGAKKPQLQSYQVSDEGIFIGDKFYPYNIFKSFNLHQEGAIGSITFMPLKRFMPEISIYYAPEDEASIVNVLSANLPNDQRREQAIDRLMKHLRF